MPSLGLSELILIGIAIIVFIRPEDLPKFVRNFGKFYTEIRRLLTKCQMYSRETLHEITQLDSAGVDLKSKFSAPSISNHIEHVGNQRSETKKPIESDKEDSDFRSPNPQ